MKEVIFESKEVVLAYLKSTLYGDLYYQVGSLTNKSMLFTFPFLGYRQLCSGITPGTAQIICSVGLMQQRYTLCKARTLLQC